MGRKPIIARRPRLSITFLTAAVLLIAVDMAIFRHVDSIEHLRDAAIITMPIVTLLILALPLLRLGSFWIGAQAAGWATACIAGYLAWTDIEWFAWPLVWTTRQFPGFESAVLKLGDAPASIIFFAFITCVYTTPMVVLSLMVGWIAARSRRRRTTYTSNPSP